MITHCHTHNHTHTHAHAHFFVLFANPLLQRAYIMSMTGMHGYT